MSQGHASDWFTRRLAIGDGRDSGLTIDSSVNLRVSVPPVQTVTSVQLLTCNSKSPD